MLLKVGEEPLEQVMRRICGSYVYWYNWKYQRIGNLFQDRFKSEAVENDNYFLTVLRYIHQNPVKAGLVKSITYYRWSSMDKYLNGTELIDTDFVLKIFDAEAKEIIKSVCQIINASDWQKMDKAQRNHYLKQLREEYRLSIRQIERLTGINRDIISKA